jgi:hypothetical protein
MRMKLFMGLFSFEFRGSKIDVARLESILALQKIDTKAANIKP